MHITKLRTVSGSVMLAVPPALLEQLQIQSGATVGLNLDHGRLVITPLEKPHYTLAQLLAESDYPQTNAKKERDWGNSPAFGRELI